MTRQIRFVAPAALGNGAGPAGAPIDDSYAAAFDLLVDACAVRAFATQNAVLGAPEPSWLGRVYPGRRIETAVARRLFLDMLAGGGVLCVLVGEPALRLETSWDGFVYADVPDDRRSVAGQLRRLGMTVDEDVPEEPDEAQSPAIPADESFWTEVRAAVPEDRPALVLECWANGAFGERWFAAARPELGAVRAQLRPRSTVAVYPDVPIHRVSRGRLREEVVSMSRVLDGLVVFPADAGIALAPSRTYSAGIEGVPDDELPPYEELAFFFSPEEEPDDPAGPRAVVPDPDGVVRAPWSC